MLVQLPGGDHPGPRNAENCDPFEAGLRRDLASAPLVSYDAMLGGVAKRAVDLSLTLLTLPLWLPMLLGAAALAKLLHGSAVHAQECIGYGGRQFRCLELRLQPAARIEPSELPLGGDWAAIAAQAAPRRAKWRRLFERLPQLLHVIAGDMALVGPNPLSREQLEPLRTARRYYLSARPGAVGVRALSADEQHEVSQYKTYAMTWSVMTDVLILWEELCSLSDRGELWRPGFKLTKSTASARSRGGAEEA